MYVDGTGSIISKVALQLRHDAAPMPRNQRDEMHADKTGVDHLFGGAVRTGRTYPGPSPPCCPGGSASDGCRSCT